MHTLCIFSNDLYDFMNISLIILSSINWKQFDQLCHSRTLLVTKVIWNRLMLKTWHYYWWHCLLMSINMFISYRALTMLIDCFRLWTTRCQQVAMVTHVPFGVGSYNLFRMHKLISIWIINIHVPIIVS